MIRLLLKIFNILELHLKDILRNTMITMLCRCNDGYHCLCQDHKEGRAIAMTMTLTLTLTLTMTMTNDQLSKS